MKKQCPFPKQADLGPLVDRARTGDQAAFTELYERTSTDLYRIIHAMVRDEDLTWDILQNTYVRVYRSLPNLRDSNAFWPWLRQIAVNETATQTAQRLPLSFTDVSGAEEQAFEIPDERTESQPELAFDRKETSQLVQDILDELSDGQRLLVGMYYFQQLPIREIAEGLRVTPGTVKTQLSRARKKIEDAVRRLERQGVKLYGLSPLPFLLALLNRQEPAAETGKAVLAKTMEEAGLAAGAKAALPAAEAVAIHVGRPFFETALGRAVLGVAVAAVIGGGVLGYNWFKNRGYGDVHPPQTVDTGEDLTTEPTETVPVKPDTGENLTTEPETSEPATTESETTEPTTTEPTTTEPEPTEPEPTEPKPLDPAHPTEPTQPTDPEIPEPSETPEPSAPAPTDPSEGGTEPTEPQKGVTVRWEDASGGLEWHAQAGREGYTGRTLQVAYPYADSMRVYTDNPDVLSIKKEKPTSHSISSDTLYVDSKWFCKPLAEGTARVYVEVGGVLEQTIPVTVQTPPSIDSIVFDTIDYGGYGESILKDCAVGSEIRFYVWFLGEERPVISSSNPAVARVSVREYDANVPGPVYEQAVTVTVVGTGDAVISMTQAGALYKSWTVHASVFDYDRTDSQEDLIPIDAPPQVMSWYICGMGGTIRLSAGASESLYVKVKGTEPPTVVSADPSVISVSAASSKWHEERNVTEYWYSLKANRSGSCTVTCSYNGGKVFTIHLFVP